MAGADDTNVNQKMPWSFLYFGVFVALAVQRLFGASSITYAKGGSVDSINLDLSITESSRRQDGALVLRASTVIEKRPVRLKLVVSDRWTVWKGQTTGPQVAKQADMEILADGTQSAFLDVLVWRSFPSEEAQRSLFCSTYTRLTKSSRDDLERERVVFWISDCGLCGDHEIQLALDLQQKSMKLVIFGVSYGRTYPDRVTEGFEKGLTISASDAGLWPARMKSTVGKR